MKKFASLALALALVLALSCTAALAELTFTTGGTAGTYYAYGTVLAQYITANTDLAAPCGLADVFSNLLKKMTDNPVAAVADANYLGVLFWSVFAGLVLKRSAGPQFKADLATMSDAVSRIQRCVLPGVW